MLENWQSSTIGLTSVKGSGTSRIQVGIPRFLVFCIVRLCTLQEVGESKKIEKIPMSAAVAVDALDHLIDEDWEWRLSDLPEFATATGDHRYDDRLDDRSVAAYQRRMNWAKDVLERVSQWEDKYGSLPYSKEITDARVSARLLTHHARGVYEGGQYHTFLCAVNRLEGPHTELPQLIDYMKFETQRDYEKYVARLRAVPQALAQVEELLRQGVTEGMLPPLVGLEGVVDQLQAVVDGLNSASGGAPPKSPLWHAAPPSVDAESARELEASALEALGAVSLSFSALRRCEFVPTQTEVEGERERAVVEYNIAPFCFCDPLFWIIVFAWTQFSIMFVFRSFARVLRRVIESTSRRRRGV